MYPLKQHRVQVHCPLSASEEDVFFHEISSGENHYAVFDGCDHQYSARPECEACQKLAFQKLVTPDSQRS